MTTPTPGPPPNAPATQSVPLARTASACRERISRATPGQAGALLRALEPGRRVKAELTATYLDRGMTDFTEAEVERFADADADLIERLEAIEFTGEARAHAAALRRALTRQVAEYRAKAALPPAQRDWDQSVGVAFHDAFGGLRNALGLGSSGCAFAGPLGTGRIGR